MPGFQISGSGGGPGPRNVVETRRKHRWVFRAFGGAVADDVLLHLQRAQRPKHSYEEAVMHHNQEEVYFPGKTKWEPITLGFYDALQQPDSSLAMWNWLNVTVQPSVASANMNYPETLKKDGTLEMLDGLNAPKGKWKLFGIWPRETNWQDLDYTSSEIMLIEVVMRFDRAIKES